MKTTKKALNEPQELISLIISGIQNTLPDHDTAASEAGPAQIHLNIKCVALL